MRVYQGLRDLGRGVEVKVIKDGKAKVLRHVCWHSPDGFEWGYGGSGPADLALSILADYFASAMGRVTRKQLQDSSHPAVKHHQAFKWEFVCKFPPVCWTLAEEQITEWLKGRQT